MIIKVHCAAHNVQNLPPVDSYRFEQVANTIYLDPREGYEFDWEQVDCPIDSAPNEHNFVIQVFHKDQLVASLFDRNPT